VSASEGWHADRRPPPAEQKPETIATSAATPPPAATSVPAVKPATETSQTSAPVKAQTPTPVLAKSMFDFISPFDAFDRPAKSSSPAPKPSVEASTPIKQEEPVAKPQTPVQAIKASGSTASRTASPARTEASASKVDAERLVSKIASGVKGQGWVQRSQCEVC
jgi:hypothetical protein